MTRGLTYGGASGAVNACVRVCGDGWIPLTPSLESRGVTYSPAMHMMRRHHISAPIWRVLKSRKNVSSGKAGVSTLRVGAAVWIVAAFCLRLDFGPSAVLHESAPAEAVLVGSCRLRGMRIWGARGGGSAERAEPICPRSQTSNSRVFPCCFFSCSRLFRHEQVVKINGSET